jgi:uncharacterized protein with HEPN domain
VTRDFRDYLDDMLEFAAKARAFAGDMTREAFQADDKTFLATARAIEIIGEAARHIPAEFRDRVPAIPWQRIIAMRNILAHNYDGADPGIIFDTATIFVPQLVALLPTAIAAAEDLESLRTLQGPSA